jgi:anti-sigma-K factor RskA
MSERVLPPDLPEDETLAAELALGVLSGPERVAAETRAARDPTFAALVEAWAERLAPLLEGVEPVEAPRGVWPRIERALPANDDTDRRLRFWKGATAAAVSLAAASVVAAVIVTVRQPPAPESGPPPLLNASLAGQPGVQPLFVTAYDPMRKALVITSLVPPGADPLHVHQLWLIPQDGQPRSLGMVEPGTSKAMPIPVELAPLVEQGAELAVSVEPPGGSTRPDGPSGPVAARGRLNPV